MDPQKLKLALLVVLVLAVIWEYHRFAKSPLGAALTSAVGSAGALLTAVAGLPSWALLGLLAAPVLGPAMLKMGGAVVERFAKRAKAGAEAIEKQGLEPAKARVAIEVVVRTAQREAYAEEVTSGSPTAAAAEAAAESDLNQFISENKGASGDAVEAGQEAAEEALAEFPAE